MNILQKKLHAGLPLVPGKWFTNNHKVIFQVHPHFLRDGPLQGFLLRQARCPLLRLAKAVSFSVCVERRFATSSLTFIKSFTSKDRSYLAEPQEDNTVKRHWIKDIFSRFP